MRVAARAPTRSCARRSARADALARARAQDVDGRARPRAGRLRAPRHRASTGSASSPRAATLRRCCACCARAATRRRSSAPCGLLAARRARGWSGTRWRLRRSRSTRGAGARWRARRTRRRGVLANTALKLVVRRPRPALPELPPLVADARRLLLSLAPTPPRRSPRRGAARRRCPAPPLLRAGRARWRSSRLYLGRALPAPTSLAGAAARRAAVAGGSARVKVGIVGLPNAGKSSLFNALTRAGAEAANYPFTTIEPNVAVVPRAGRAARPGGRDRRRHAGRARDDRVPRHRRAGARRAQGRGAGQPVPRATSARPTRSCTWCARTTTRRSCTPRAAWTRSPTSRRSRPSCSRRPRAGRAPARARGQAGEVGRQGAGGRGGAGCASVVEALQAGRAGAHRAAARRRARTRCAACRPLTAKPVLYVANVGRGRALEPPAALAAHARRAAPRAVAVSARIEAELAELDDDEAARDARGARRGRVGARDAWSARRSRCST